MRSEKEIEDSLAQIEEDIQKIDAKMDAFVGTAKTKESLEKLIQLGRERAMLTFAQAQFYWILEK